MRNVIICLLALVVLSASAHAKPEKKSNKQTVLITFVVIEDNEATDCDPGIRLTVAGVTYDADCDSGIAAFKVVVPAGKNSFTLSNTDVGEVKFDRTIARKSSWFLHTIQIEITNGIVVVGTSNTNNL
jgi:hypothetical protein